MALWAPRRWSDDTDSVAEPTGPDLRPELVAPLPADLRQAVLLVPAEAFRQRRLRELPRAGRVSAEVSDPERARADRGSP
ncbi:hypothetical protein [Saccharothrix sp. Mg75]|uniref:hypothetical protein n=1 Tax=Saccharothrix sp. Mg75 TaxID=3445357 RepID=UPI003EE9F7C5